jgi:argininosuccinate lyase
MMATDLADYLVERGVSFREAHESVGQLVRQSEEQGIELHALPKAAFRAAHVQFGDDVFDALSPRRSIERRDVDGGTGPTSIRTQIELAAASLIPAPEPRGNELSLRVG